MFESSLTTLNCVYLALFFVGLGYAIFVAITGGLSDIDMPNVDIDVPQIDLPGDVDIPGAGVHIGGADIAAGTIGADWITVIERIGGQGRGGLQMKIVIGDIAEYRINR